MPYYGLNIKIIVHSHKYQPVRGHCFFFSHAFKIELLCLHLCIIAHWLADKMTWHKSRQHKRWLIRFNILSSFPFQTKWASLAQDKWSRSVTKSSLNWKAHSSKKGENRFTNLSGSNLSKKFVNLFSLFLEQCVSNSRTALSQILTPCLGQVMPIWFESQT